MNKAFQALLKLTGGIAITANAAGTLVVLGLVGLVNFDVIARGFFNSPFRGAIEVVQFSMVLIVFLQLPDVIRVNRLTCSDGFQLVMAKRYPTFVSILQRLIDALSMAFMALIAVAIYPEFQKMWASNDFFGIPGVFTAPWWPVKLVILISATLCAVLFAGKVIYGKFHDDPARRSEFQGANN